MSEFDDTELAIAAPDEGALLRIEEAFEAQTKQPVTASQVGRVFQLTDGVTHVMIAPTVQGRAARLKVAASRTPLTLWLVVGAMVAMVVPAIALAIVGAAGGILWTLAFLVAAIVGAVLGGQSRRLSRARSRRRLEALATALADRVGPRVVLDDVHELAQGDGDEVDDEVELDDEVDRASARRRNAR